MKQGWMEEIHYPVDKWFIRMFIHMYNHPRCRISSIRMWDNQPYQWNPTLSKRFRTPSIKQYQIYVPFHHDQENIKKTWWDLNENILLAPFVTEKAKVCRNVFGKTRSTFESQNQRLRGVKEQRRWCNWKWEDILGGCWGIKWWILYDWNWVYWVYGYTVIYID